MKILDGKLASIGIIDKVREEINDILLKTNGRIRLKVDKPKMAIVLVGSHPASESYVKNKTKACDNAGIESKIIRFQNDITEEELIQKVKVLNKSEYDGFIIQLPLPEHISAPNILNEISFEKDIDGFSPVNFGRMALGLKAHRPATAYGILKLIQHYNIETKGKHVVVIGRSNIVGKPIAIMLGNDFNIGRSTVTSCDINTPKDLLVQETKRADIVIVAAGVPNLLTEDMVKEGVIVIDVGINKLGDKIVGDVDFENVFKKASWITPVPGGVGPMTIAGLILNTVDAWKQRNYIN
jgi:methylenetetrahydrofolate dehydrogenase (NADP+) / methenyltetrahydrofolate cyclohydrolase